MKLVYIILSVVFAIIVLVFFRESFGVLCLIGFSIVILVWFFSKFFEWIKIRNWPKVDGLIIQIEGEFKLDDEFEGYVKRITYSYFVDNVKYLSNRVSLEEDVIYSSKKGAEISYNWKYQEGSKTIVYYNPYNPSDAIIENNFPITILIFLIILVVIAVLIEAVSS